MLRFYLMPMTVTATRRLEKYRTEMLNAGIQWQSMAYGAQPVFLIGAEVDATQHGVIVTAHADVSAFPPDLDSTLGANRQAVEDALESHNLPGSWVTQGMTYRSLVRILVGVILIAQRFRGFDTSAGGDGSLFPQGVTLNTAYVDMPVGFRTRLVDVVTSLGFSLAGLTGSSSLRDLLRTIGQRQSPIQWLGVEV